MTINNNEKFWELNYNSPDHNNEYKFYQNFATFSKTFTFDDLSNSLEEESVTSNVLNKVDSTNVFQSVFQARSVNYADNLSILHGEIDTIFNSEQIVSDSDLFFSLTSNSASLEHTEDYDCFYLNLLGSFYLIMNNTTQIVGIGDAFYIPQGASYHVIGSTPFIIFSFGLRGDVSRYYPWDNETTSTTPPETS